ncbi:chemotaxis protein CheW [Sneathiella sp. P13V-1]|uniref:chemotaxis protein CheW n=1 Tax=Sneathiella sp. P13V-1 TaxID=2697366 RepID=UPI00187B7511|nr:chemotaxis protein CheW [Sneathiella sp. P13V-1]MBE7637712.1 chemotaxis protein CheW [Sneathiella sp. P13V-1]
MEVEQNISPASSAPADAPPQIAEGSDTASEIQGIQQFVTFAIGNEEYAVDIMKVREIQAWSEVTILPNQPSYMRGVLNLRGIIVPIFDLRCRFGQGVTDATSIHVVVIVAVKDRIIGILVDRVSDILTVEGSEICKVPDLDDRQDEEHILGLVTAGERMVALLDIASLFHSEIIETSIDVADANGAPQS